MPRCIAYRRVPGCPHTWVRCAGRALRGDDYCRRHLDAMRGIVLGAMALICPDEMQQEPQDPRDAHEPFRAAPRKPLVN